MMMKDDGCTSRSGLRLDPSDIPIFSLEDDVQPLGRRIPENQKFNVRISDLNRRIIDAHGLGSNFVRTDYTRQPLAEYFFNLEDGRCRDNACAIAAPLAGHIAAFMLEDLFFDLVQHGSNGGVHIGGHFLAMVEVIPRFDIHFREVALVFLDREDEMRLENFVNNSP
jgi:hypothetical protein